MFRAGLALFAAAFLTAAIPIPLSKPQTSGGQQGANQQQNPTTSERGPQGTPDTLSPPKPRGPVVISPANNLEGHANAHDEPSGFLGIPWDGWVAIFSGLLVAVSTWQGVQIKRAEFLTKQALRVSQKQSVRSKIDARNRAIEAKEALDAARAANDITRATGRDQTRAYLVVKHAWLYTHEVFEANVSLEIVNVGHSPAKWVETEGNAHILADIETKANEVPLNPVGMQKLRWSLDPGIEGNQYPCEVARDEKAFRILVSEARHEKKSIVVQGTVRWETVFGEIFESTFFFWDIPQSPEWKRDESGSMELKPQRLSAPAVETVTYRLVREAEATQTKA